MKYILLFLISFNLFAFSDQKVGGTVVNSKFKEVKPSKKSLLVITVFNDKKILLALNKITNPKFPQAFVVTPKNIVRPDVVLDGMVKVVGKYYPDGEGGKIFTALDINHDLVSVGKKDIQLEVIEEGK